MRTEIMRTKSLAVIIAITVTIAFSISTIQVNATTSVNQGTNSAENLFTEIELNCIENSHVNEEGIDNVIQLLESSGLDAIDARVDDGKACFDVEVGNITDVVTVETANDETIELSIVEGDKNDTIKIDDADNVYLNGTKVEVTEEETIESDEVLANAQARYATCPYGKASNYTYYAKTTKKNIKLAKTIAQYTIVAIVAVLTYELGLVGAVASSVAGEMAKNALASDGNIIKSKAKVYYNKKKKKFMVTSSVGCQKEVTTFYGKGSHVLSKKTLWLYNHVNGA